MVRLLLCTIFIYATLAAAAGGAVTIWADTTLGVRIEALPQEPDLPEQHTYRISYMERGEAKQFLDTIVFLRPMLFDSAHVYLRQLDAKGLPELVFRGEYHSTFASGQLKSRTRQSVFIVWDLRRSRRMFDCIPLNTWYVEKVVYDDNGKAQTIYGDCEQQFNVGINDKNQIVVTSLKDESSGPAIEHYLCDPLRIDMGVYQLSELSRYQWLKAR